MKTLKPELAELDNEQKVFRFLALHPEGTTRYTFTKKEKTARVSASTAMRIIDDENGVLIRCDETTRGKKVTKKLYNLTLLGLAHALKIEAIEPRQIRKTLKSELEEFLKGSIEAVRWLGGKEQYQIWVKYEPIVRPLFFSYIDRFPEDICRVLMRVDEKACADRWGRFILIYFLLCWIFLKAMVHPGRFKNVIKGKEVFLEMTGLVKDFGKILEDLGNKEAAKQLS